MSNDHVSVTLRVVAIRVRGIKSGLFKRMALEMVAGHYKCVTPRVVTIKVM